MHASPVVSIKQDELCKGRPITVVERYIFITNAKGNRYAKGTLSSDLFFE